MIAPDRDAFDIGRVRTGLFGELRECAVVIEPHHRGEAFRIEFRRILLCNQRVRIRGIADHEHFHFALRVRVQRLALRREDRAVGFEQVLALHACAARTRADEQRVVDVLERDVRVIGRDDTRERRKRAIVEFHRQRHATRQRGRDFKQLQDHRLILAEHVAGGDAEQQGIADLAGCAGDGNADGGFHRMTPMMRFDSWKAELITGLHLRRPAKAGIPRLARRRLAPAFARATVLSQFCEKLAEAFQAFRQLRRRAGIGNPKRIRIAERGTRHAGDAFSIQKRIAEIDVVRDLPADDDSCRTRTKYSETHRTRLADADRRHLRIVHHREHLIALGLKFRATLAGNVLRSGQARRPRRQ